MVLGISENDARDYKIVVSKKRDTETMKNLVYRFIPEGNRIVTDAWALMIGLTIQILGILDIGMSMVEAIGVKDCNPLVIWNLFGIGH